MPFKAILRKLVEAVPDASGAILADWEGESVEHYCNDDDFELKIVGAHSGIILNQLREINSRISAAAPRETVITTDLGNLMIGAVGPDYFLVMTLVRAALIGRAVRHFRNAVTLLYKEIY